MNASLRWGLGLLTLLILAALAAPLITPHAPTAPNYGLMYAPPSLTHPLGTDELGRDVFSRVLFGGRYSLSVALLAVLLAAGVGSLLGLISGGRGTPLDLILTRLTDALLAFPGLLLVLLAVIVLGNGMLQTILALGLFGVPIFFRLARGYLRQLSSAEYVLAAEASGASNLRLLLRHVLPNILGFLVVQAASAASLYLLAEASLSYLGLGVPPPTPTWGNILQESRNYLLRQPWAALGPGLVLGMSALAFQLIADGYRARLGRRQG